MAKVTPSDLAPDEVVHYNFADIDFDLGPGKTFVIDDEDVASVVAEHTWLSVEFAPGETQKFVPEPTSNYIAPGKDPMTLIGSLGFNDEDEIAKAEALKGPAIDAHEPPVFTKPEPVAETVDPVAKTVEPVSVPDETPKKDKS